MATDRSPPDAAPGLGARTVDRVVRGVAAEAVLPRFRALATGDIREKRPGDVVTVADEESERLLAARLSPLIEGAAVVGEEGAEANAESLNALTGNRPVWILDPVDGTQNFADGVDCFGMIVALCQDGEALAGWIHDPVNGTTLYAARGGGAWWWSASGDSANRLRLGDTPPMADMTGYFGPRLRRDLDRRRAAGERGVPHAMPRLKCVAREYMELARGERHFARYGGRLKPWDHAAGVLALREAGGVARSPDDGRDYHPRAPREASILLAPDEAAWQALAAFKMPR